MRLGTGGRRWKGNSKITLSLSKVDVVEPIRQQPAQLGRNQHGIGTAEAQKMRRVISHVNVVGRKEVVSIVQPAHTSRIVGVVEDYGSALDPLRHFGLEER